MKVLFLDMDGVLNNRASMMRAAAGVHPPGELGRMLTVDAECVARLRRVVEETGAKIVVSSTWRFHGIATVERALAWAGWVDAPIIGCTTLDEVRSPGGLVMGDRRGVQIAQWLDENALALRVESYAIVDDDGDMLDDQWPRFVKTTFEAGLTDEHAAELRSLLS